MEKGIPITTASDAHSHVQLGENFSRPRTRWPDRHSPDLALLKSTNVPRCRYNEIELRLSPQKTLLRFRWKRQIETEPFGETLHVSGANPSNDRR